jgi:uncharacterized protein (TIGR02646 family)
MIHIERGPAPAGYKRLAGEAERRLARFFDRAYEERTQEPVPFVPRIWKRFRPQLFARFHRKCAYCETPLNAEAFDIEMFRPKALYPLLAYAWDNLLVACRACNAAKANRFPLDPESEPLLLDPCNDKAEQHLVFGRDGRVISATPRGQATIDTLNLNRLALVAARQATGQQIDALLLHATKISGRALRYVKATMLADDAPYAGAARQLMPPASARGRQGAAAADRGPVATTKSVYAAHEQEIESFSLSAKSGLVSAHYFAKRRAIERIEIRNFKAIQRLDINLAAAPEQASSWLMILGENATGKSSILRALALTLMNQQARRQLGLKPDDVLSHGKPEGQVRIWLTGVSAPVELAYRRGDGEFSGASEEKVLMLGYGANRMLPNRGQSSLQSGPVRVTNLFDPAAHLVDAETWLAGLPTALFAVAARVLKEVLPLRKQDKLETGEDPARPGRHRIFVRMYGEKAFLHELSDGYQSVVAMAADVLSVLLPVWKERVDSAEGVVLIDELDAHLHPVWRMQIVRTLRACFPHVQFITTSHDPLCLKGLTTGEIIVLCRNRRGTVVAREDLPSPAGMSADQLLTSEHFGLGSTIEPEIELLFREYYSLLARKGRSEAQAARLRQLKGTLARLNHMGRTRREQLMLEVIDAYLSEAPRPGRRAQEERRRSMLEQLTALWTGRDLPEDLP